MAKLTEEQKAEMKKIKAIPNKELTTTLASFNKFLKGAKKDLVITDKKSKGGTVANLVDAVQTMIEADEAQSIPDDVVAFYNKYLVGEDAAEDGGEETPKDEKSKDNKKTAAKKPRKTKAEIQARYDMFTKLIGTGKHTKKEIVDKVAEKFTDVKPITLSTFVQDCMNEKYNKLDKLTVKGEDGKLSFKK